LNSRFCQFSIVSELKSQICIGISIYPENRKFPVAPQLAEIITPEPLVI
jgi:hypothetical protein